MHNERHESMVNRTLHGLGERVIVIGTKLWSQQLEIKEIKMEVRGSNHNWLKSLR